MRVSSDYMIIGLGSLVIGVGWGMYFVWYEYPAYTSSFYAQCARSRTPCPLLGPATIQPAFFIAAALAILGVALFAWGFYLRHRSRSNQDTGPSSEKA